MDSPRPRNLLYVTEIGTVRENAEIAETEIGREDDVQYFTWNPNDKKLGYFKTHTDKWDAMYIKVLIDFRLCMSKYCIVPEVSEVGRLHCHGWYVKKDNIKYHKRVLPKLNRYGQFKPSKRRSANGDYYYKKTSDDIREIVPRCILPLSHLSEQDCYTYYLTKILNKSKKTLNEKKYVQDKYLSGNKFVMANAYKWDGFIDWAKLPDNPDY